MSLLLPLLALAVAASPQQPVFRPGEAEAARFQRAFAAGEAQYLEGDYGAAVASFRLADRLRATPEVAFDLARCHERLGDRAFALYYDRLYLRRAPSAPDTLDVAQRVGKALGRAQAEGVGFLELEAPLAAQLTVDGRLYPEGPVAAFLPPGEHELGAEFSGGRRAMRVQLKAGKTLPLTFEPAPPPLLGTERALPEAVLAAGRDSAQAPGLSGLQVGSVIAGAVGLAAVATGVVLAVLAAGEASRAHTDPSLGAAQAQALAAQAETKSLVSSILFGVGGASLGTGGVLLLVSFAEP